MKRLITIPVYCILWVLSMMLFCLIVLIDMNKRSDYMAGKSKGMKCIGHTNSLTSFTDYFDHTQKPVKEYLTFKEYRNGRAYPCFAKFNK